MVSEPNNLMYLINHLWELPEDARKYIIWASFFGATYVPYTPFCSLLALTIHELQLQGYRSRVDDGLGRL